MSQSYHDRSQKPHPSHRDRGRSPSTDSGYSSRSGSYPPTPTTSHAQRSSRRHDRYSDDDNDDRDHRRGRTTYDTLAKTSVLVGVLSVLAGALQIWTTRQAVKRDCARDREEWERIRRRGGGGGRGERRRRRRRDAERGGDRGDDGFREQEEKWVRRQRIEGWDEETRGVRRMIEAPREGSYGDGETVVSEREQRRRARRRESSRSRP